MADKVFFIKKGSRISIEINNSATSSNRNAQNAQGLIRSRRESDYLPRRLKPVGGINFYDLGQIKNESDIFISNTASLIPTISIAGDVTISTNETELEKETLVADMETIVFLVDEADWLTKFFKIQKLDTDFEKSISVLIDASGDPFFGTLNDAEQWTSGGLTLTQSQVNELVVQPNGLLYAIGNINFADLSNDISRITATRDIEADEVEFTPSPKMDILLMPSIQNSQAYTKYFDGLHVSGPQSDFITRGDHLNYFRSVIDRGLWDQFIALSEMTGLTSYENAYQTWQILKQFTNARGRRLTYDFADTPPYPYSTVMNTLSPSAFPYSPIYTNTPDPSAPDAFTNNISFTVGLANDLFQLQFLKFIIRQNNQTFYFWFEEA